MPQTDRALRLLRDRQNVQTFVAALRVQASLRVQVTLDVARLTLVHVLALLVVLVQHVTSRACPAKEIETMARDKIQCRTLCRV